MYVGESGKYLVKQILVHCGGWYWIGNDSDSLQAFYTYYLCGIYLFTCLGHDNGRVVLCQNTSAGKFIFKSFASQPNMCPPPQQVLAVAVAS